MNDHEDDHRIPGSLLYIIFNSVEEQLGKNGLNTLLRRAGLEEYIDNPPPNDATPTMKPTKLKDAIRSVVELFGERAAKPLLLRWGRLTFEYSLEQNPALFGLAGLVFKFVSEEKKMRFILQKALKESDDLFGVVHLLTEDSENFHIEIIDCYYCGGIQSSTCICWQPVGFWRSLIKWATGKEHEVKEIECRAQGKESCKFIISKKSV